MITRRAFTASAVAGATAGAAQEQKPNILWITCEDTGPHLHYTGDEYSVTPNLDKLCARSSTYMNAWSNAPVCAPARTTIISGLYPTSLGAEHMRSLTKLAPEMRMFPAYLREAGYYCSNNVKEDYNLEKPPGTWDDSSRNAHFRKRAQGQQFFSVFNFTVTHESQIRARPHTLVHDPAKARVPAYHPDTPEVRHDWAQYYDNITTMDGQAGKLLAELAQDGLADDTIVFFYGDHGSGMPRSKRWPYNSGLNVSITVHIPEKFRHLAPKDYVPGGKNSRLVGFVDLAPTMLSLAGLRAPDYYQGQAFLGRHEAAPRTYSFGFRGRMDERYDCVRTVRDQRYVYVRHYMPHKIYGQHLNYMWETPTTQVWERLYKEGKLNEAQKKFWETKPPEELYDLNEDRDEVKNLAGSSAHKAELERLRKAHREHELKIKDVGLLAESEIHSRAKGLAPYVMGHDPKRYDAPKTLAAAELASSLRPGATDQLKKLMSDADSAARYWGALGVQMRGAAEVTATHAALDKLLSDSDAAVRIAAAAALGRYGNEADLKKAMDVLLPLCDPTESGVYAAMEALNAVDSLGAKAKPWAKQILALPTDDPKAPERVRSEYLKRLHEAIAGLG
ncbi:MAG: sulfatase [Acidobacteria bacterium]|nr:sulfatase [Acidobacteriota bacterium]